MSRFLVFFAGTLFVAFVTGCGGGDSKSSSSSKSDTTVASAPASSPTTAASPSSTPTSTPGSPGDSAGLGGGPGGAGGHPDMAEMMKSMGGGAEQSGPPEGKMDMAEMMKSRGGADTQQSGPPAGQNMEEMMKSRGGAGGQQTGPPQGQNMEEMMKSRGGAGGAGQPGGPGPGQNMQEMMLAMANGGNGAGAGPVKERPEPKTFKEKSDYAFEDGRDADAFQYLFAHYLTEPSAVNDQQLYWVPGLDSPRTVVRWGVAIDYSAPKDFTKAPPKIGDQPNVLPEKKGSGGQPGPGQFPGGPGMRPGVGGPGMGGPGIGGGAAEPADPLGKVAYYTGDIGNRILEELDKRRTSTNPYFGAALAQIQFELQTVNTGGGGAAGVGGMDPRMQMMAQGGGPGVGGPGIGGPGVGGPGIGGPQGNAPVKASFDATQLIPGVVFLGKGDSGEMLKLAKAHSVDVLLLFTVKVGEVKKTGLETNNTQVSLYNVDTGKSLYKQSGNLNNVSYWTAKEKNRDLIDDLIDDLFTKAVDGKLAAQEMPQRQESEVFERVKQLVVDKEYSNPLPVLAEICYYHEAGEKLLPDNAYNSAVARLIGKDNAELFLNGNPEDKARAIVHWLPPKWRPAAIGGEFKK